MSIAALCLMALVLEVIAICVCIVICGLHKRGAAHDWARGIGATIFGFTVVTAGLVAFNARHWQIWLLVAIGVLLVALCVATYIVCRRGAKKGSWFVNQSGSAARPEQSVARNEPPDGQHRSVRQYQEPPAGNRRARPEGR